MKHLRTYLNGLDKEARAAFLSRCGTTENYIRKAISNGSPLGASLCINIDRESGGAISCESLRSDVDWAYLRSHPHAGGAHE